jgi:cytoskeletal protein RodZ
MAKMVPDERARQGPRGRPVFYVLIGSLVLLGIYMVSLMTWATKTSDNPQVSQESSRKTSDPSSTGSTSSSNASSVPSANPAYPAPANRTAEPSGGKGGNQYGAPQR